MSTVQERLTEWARWHRSSGEYIGYPQETAFNRMSRQGRATVPAANCTDDEALSVDSAVSALRSRSEGADLRWEVLARRYLNGHPDTTIARELDLSRHTVRELGIAAESWVESRLDP